MAAICPKCAEVKRVAITVGTPSERFPIPIWRFKCGICGKTWLQDDNLLAGKPERDEDVQ